MEKIKKIRKALRREKIDGYLIPKNDKFFGEYISRSDDRLNYISNFKDIWVTRRIDIAKHWEKKHPKN